MLQAPVFSPYPMAVNWQTLFWLTVNPVLGAAQGCHVGFFFKAENMERSWVKSIFFLLSASESLNLLKLQHILLLLSQLSPQPKPTVLAGSFSQGGPLHKLW